MAAPLRVGAAFPDPPFNGAADDGGLDVDLMRAISESLGRTVDFVRYTGVDFNGIFDRLGAGDYDCVASGTTVTPQRRQQAVFCDAYLISGQSLATDVRRHPHIRGTADLDGLTIGVQQGNTSQPIADELVAAGRAGAVRVYDYGAIRTAIDDLTTGGCDVFMKLSPVLTELVRPVDGVEVVARGLSTESIAVAVRTGDHDLLARINGAQATLEASGALADIRGRWLGRTDLDQRGADVT